MHLTLQKLFDILLTRINMIYSQVLIHHETYFKLNKKSTKLHWFWISLFLKLCIQTKKTLENQLIHFFWKLKMILQLSFHKMIGRNIMKIAVRNILWLTMAMKNAKRLHLMTFYDEVFITNRITTTLPSQSNKQLLFCQIYNSLLVYWWTFPWQVRQHQ
jgi:hypothetical protein